MLSRPPAVIHRLARSRQAGAAIECSLVVALISVAAVAVLTDLGQRIENILDAATSATT